MGAGSGKVLLVDDDPNNLEVLSVRLEAGGYDTLKAADGVQGLDVLDENPDVDLILLDFQMPRMSGLEVLKEVQRERPDIPVVIMTAFGSQELVLEAMKGGAADYLVKPVDPRKIMEIVESNIARHREVIEVQKMVEVERTKKPFMPLEVFVLNPSGLVVLHRSRKETSHIDRDIFGGMLTAVRTFISDSFTDIEGGMLNTLVYGDLRILIEGGSDFHLVLVGKGEKVGDIRERIKRAVWDLRRQAGEEIKDWSGRRDLMDRLVPVLEDLLA